MATIRSSSTAALSAAAAVVGAVCLVVLLARVGATPADTGSQTQLSDPVADRWAGLGPEERCNVALALVAAPRVWPVICRLRATSDDLQGRAFPPPIGDPPFDQPHVEIYVAPEQSVEEVASAIAHELGHMHHTRDPRFVPDWLVARALPPDTPDAVWTEDYAEVFALLFGPPVGRWRAPTPAPLPADLPGLRARFFADV